MELARVESLGPCESVFYLLVSIYPSLCKGCEKGAYSRVLHFTHIHSSRSLLPPSIQVFTRHFSHTFMCACVLLARTLTERDHRVVLGNGRNHHDAAHAPPRGRHGGVDLVAQQPRQSANIRRPRIAHLRWDAITCLHQYINGLVVNSMGEVAAQDARSWPMAKLVTRAWEWLSDTRFTARDFQT